MRKMQQDSKKKSINTTKPKDGVNKRGRKNKGQDEKKPESAVSHVRPGRSHEEVLEKPVVKRKSKKIVEPEGPRSFNANALRTGDKFTFLAPGKGKKTYVCTVIGSEVLFERNDKHTYTRQLQEMPEIVRVCNLVCTLI